MQLLCSFKAKTNKLSRQLEPTRQGPALLMSIESKALDIILEIDDKDISSGNDVTVIINKLKNTKKMN